MQFHNSLWETYIHLIAVQCTLHSSSILDTLQGDLKLAKSPFPGLQQLVAVLAGEVLRAAV